MNSRTNAVAGTAEQLQAAEEKGSKLQAKLMQCSLGANTAFERGASLKAESSTNELIGLQLVTEVWYCVALWPSPRHLHERLNRRACTA